MQRYLIASFVQQRCRLPIMRGGPLIREARLRAGLTQSELADRTGRERSVIARWEQGAVSPSIDNLLAIIHACEFELPLVIVPRDTSQDEQLEEGRILSPERRVDRLIDRVQTEGKAARG
jgi:transcriptional regulator with XRE-family HTH domain